MFLCSDLVVILAMLFEHTLQKIGIVRGLDSEQKFLHFHCLLFLRSSFTSKYFLDLGIDNQQHREYLFNFWVLLGFCCSGW
jgi:hypothetical protein